VRHRQPRWSAAGPLAATDGVPGGRGRGFHPASENCCVDTTPGYNGYKTRSTGSSLQTIQVPRVVLRVPASVAGPLTGKPYFAQRFCTETTTILMWMLAVRCRAHSRGPVVKRPMAAVGRLWSPIGRFAAGSPCEHACTSRDAPAADPSAPNRRKRFMLSARSAWSSKPASSVLVSTKMGQRATPSGSAPYSRRSEMNCNGDRIRVRRSRNG